MDGGDENDIDIFEWISAEDLRDDAPAKLTGMREVGAYSSNKDGSSMTFEYCAPEYRRPRNGLQVAKCDLLPPVLDQAPGRYFNVDMAELVEKHGREDYDLSKVDIVTSMSVLRLLVAFIDGSLQEDCRSKGLHTRKGAEPALIDIARISRIAEAPEAICLGGVWNWAPCKTFHKLMNYTPGFQAVAIGSQSVRGPPSVRKLVLAHHYRLLEYTLGDLRILVRVPVIARIPSEEADDVQGHGIEIDTMNRRKADTLWDRALAARFACMQLGDCAMVSRGIFDNGHLIEVQEITQDDFVLDRPGIEEETAELLGRLAGLLHRVREVSNLPGPKDRILYLNYSDAELRVIAPVFDGEMDDEDDEEGEDRDAPVGAGAAGGLSTH